MQRLIDFLNVVKYPPGITFLLLTLGIDLVLLAIFARIWRGKPSSRFWYLNPLFVFGKTPLFFYILHLYLYGFIGRTFFSEGTGIPGMFIWWLAGLVILYPFCLVYGRFQDTRAPDSIWRFF
jgi:predicted acyltransferase